MAPDSQPVLRKISTSAPWDWPRISTFFGVLALSSLGFGLAWANHFSSGFHLDDTAAIVNNRSIRELSAGIGRAFSEPRAFSSSPPAASYVPLLTSIFTIDYKLAGDRTDPLLFQLQNFVWFALQLLLIYIVARMVSWPGSRRRGRSHYLALFPALLYGLHPLTAETVNYAVQGGRILAGLGMLTGLVLWIACPRLLPEDLRLKVPKVPKTDWDAWKRDMQPKVSAVYKGIRNFPFPWYLIPVGLGMLASPVAAAFAPILLVYVLMFDRERGPRSTIPAFGVCEGYWFFQTVWSWRTAGSPAVSSAGYWLTLPWATVRYFLSFFVPVNISSISNLQPYGPGWAPRAVAGFAGFAVLLVAAVMTARKPRLLGISFGLWWFLIAAVQDALIPKTSLEAFPRAWVAYIGLTFAIGAAVRLWLGQYFAVPGESGMLAGHLAVPAAIVFLLATLGYETNQRNAVWQSDQTLWADVLAKNPNDGYALMNYGMVLMTMPGDDLYNVRHISGIENLRKAEKLLPNDATAAVDTGIADEYFGLDDAQTEYKRAIALKPGYAAAWSNYANWLLKHNRINESRDAALKAAGIDSGDMLAKRVLADGYLAQRQWSAARQQALETLAFSPGDEDATRELNVAEAGLRVVADAENDARQYPSVDSYLNLAVQYFENNRFEDSIRADREALKLNPELVEAWINMAATYRAMHRLDDTIESLQQAEKLRPDIPMIKGNLQAAKAEKESGGANAH